MDLRYLNLETSVIKIWLLAQSVSLYLQRKKQRNGTCIRLQWDPMNGERISEHINFFLRFRGLPLYFITRPFENILSDGTVQNIYAAAPTCSACCVTVVCVDVDGKEGV